MDTCFVFYFMGHFRRRIRWRHSFSNLTREKVNFWLNYAKLGQISKLKIYLRKYLYLEQIYRRIKKSHLFLCTTTKNAKEMHFKNSVSNACNAWTMHFKNSSKNYFGKKDFFDFWESKSKISRIRDAYFVRRWILRRLAFFYCVLFQN